MNRYVGTLDGNVSAVNEGEVGFASVPCPYNNCTDNVYEVGGQAGAEGGNGSV